LSLLSSGSLVISPDVPEAHALKGWYMDGGSHMSFKSHTQAGLSSAPGGAVNRNEMRTINEIKDAQLGMSDKTDYFSMRATVMHIKTDNIVYPACPTPQCNKKVIESHDGWRCEKCDRSHEMPEYRSVQLAPHLFIYLVIRRTCLAGTSLRWPSLTPLISYG
jgi:replication factor A1